MLTTRIRKPGFLFDVPIEHFSENPAISLMMSTNTSRLQNQQNSLRSVPVGVVLSANSVNDVVAESQAAENTGLARLLKPGVLQLHLYFLSDQQVSRISHS